MSFVSYYGFEVLTVWISKVRPIWIVFGQCFWTSKTVCLTLIIDTELRTESYKSMLVLFYLDESLKWFFVLAWWPHSQQLHKYFIRLEIKARLSKFEKTTNHIKVCHLQKHFFIVREGLFQRTLATQAEKSRLWPLLSIYKRTVLYLFWYLPKRSQITTYISRRAYNDWRFIFQFKLWSNNLSNFLENSWWYLALA